jgi:hypothetical protein
MKIYHPIYLSFSDSSYISFFDGRNFLIVNSPLDDLVLHHDQQDNSTTTTEEIQRQKPKTR